MTELLIGTSSGLFGVNGAGLEADDAFGARPVTALAASRGAVYAIGDRRTLLRPSHRTAHRATAR